MGLLGRLLGTRGMRMGFLDFLKKKDGPGGAEGGAGADDGMAKGKYADNCTLCGKGPTEKKWMAQYFHKKCFRKMKKVGKGMI